MRRFFILAAMLVSAAACGDATGPNGQVTGTYRLETINGQQLPFTFTDNAGNLVTVSSDQLTLASDGSYQDTAIFSDGGSSTEFGTYTSINGSIQFTDRSDGGLQYGGSLSGSVLTEISNNGSLTEVFQKE
jgi:hypothetical protein